MRKVVFSTERAKRIIMTRSQHWDIPSETSVRGCIQKFPDWVDNEIYAYFSYYLLRSNTKDYGGKPTRLTHEMATQLHLVAESCTICNFRSRRPVRKLLDTPSYLYFPECSFNGKTQRSQGATKEPDDCRHEVQREADSGAHSIAKP